jgi:hypothetical protein
LHSSKLLAYNPFSPNPKSKVIRVTTKETLVANSPSASAKTHQPPAPLGLDVLHFIFSTLILTTARPGLVTNASIASRAPAKKGREAKEFWNPAIIGANYKIRREAKPPQGGTHASPRFHWVQGFLREQPYAPAERGTRQFGSNRTREGGHDR